MADDFRPHLLITEGDVETLENKKQARAKDLGLDRMEHGTKLSTGLQEIVFVMRTSACLRSFFKRVKSFQTKRSASSWSRKE